MTEPRPWRAGLLLVAAVFLSACAVDHGDANGIAVSHSARHSGGAQWQADKHCAQFGKKAVLVRKGPKQSDNLVETNVSEFECVN